MPRKALTKQTIRTLFARSGNQCAFPGCNHQLIDDENDYIAQICHIEAALPNGERYNINMSDEERSSPENLILLCYAHHIKTNDTKKYTVERLKEIKRLHEQKFKNTNYQLENSTLEKIYKEQNKFFNYIAEINSAWQKEFELAAEINIKENPLLYIDEIENNIKWIRSFKEDITHFLTNLDSNIASYIENIGIENTAYKNQKYYENPFFEHEWERRNIGIPNINLKIDTNVALLRFFLLHNLAKQAGDLTEFEHQISKQKEIILELASKAAYVD